MKPDAQSPVVKYLWIPKKFLETPWAFINEFDKYGYKMTVKLLDENGNTICSQQFGFVLVNCYVGLPYPGHYQHNAFFLAALKGESTATCYRRKCNITFTNFASSEDMLKVKRLVAFVEPVKKVREPTLRFVQWMDHHKYDHKYMGWGWYEH